jgi:hypothetical protein
MSGTLDFLLSPEEKSFLKAATKSMHSPAFEGAALFSNNTPVAVSGFPTIDYSQRSVTSVVYDLVGMLTSQFQELRASRA